MRVPRPSMLAAAILINIPFFLTILCSDSVGNFAHDIDLGFKGYDGCKCGDCLEHNLTWSKTWRIRPDGFICGNGRRAQQDLNTMLGFISAPFAICAFIPRKKRKPGYCTCGYALAGLAPGAKCPECGVISAQSPLRP